MKEGRAQGTGNRCAGNLDFWTGGMRGIPVGGPSTNSGIFVFGHDEQSGFLDGGFEKLLTPKHSSNELNS